MIKRQIVKSQYLSFGSFLSKSENETSEYRSQKTDNIIKKPIIRKMRFKSDEKINQKIKFNISTEHFDLKKQAYRNLYRKQLNINYFNYYKAQQKLNVKKGKIESQINHSFSPYPKKINLHQILHQAKKYILTDNNSKIGSHRRELLSLNNNPFFKKNQNIFKKHDKMSFGHELSPYDANLSRITKKNVYKFHHNSDDLISNKLFILKERMRMINENQKNIIEKKKKIVESKKMKERISFLNKTYDYLYPKYVEINDRETYRNIPLLLQEDKIPFFNKEKDINNETKQSFKAINIFIHN